MIIIMKLVNINYHCELVGGLKTLKFSPSTPYQSVIRVPGKYTLIVFPSGRGRLMGIKSPLTSAIVTVGAVSVRVGSIQSATVVVNMQRTYDLHDVAKKLQVMYEPELFPAARVLKFNPLCVNLFCSGKVVITGLKTFHYYKQVEQIIKSLENV